MRSTNKEMCATYMQAWKGRSTEKEMTHYAVPHVSRTLTFTPSRRGGLFSFSFALPSFHMGKPVGEPISRTTAATHYVLVVTQQMPLEIYCRTIQFGMKTWEIRKGTPNQHLRRNFERIETLFRDSRLERTHRTAIAVACAGFDTSVSMLLSSALSTLCRISVRLCSHSSEVCRRFQVVRKWMRHQEMSPLWLIMSPIVHCLECAFRNADGKSINSVK